MTDHPCKSMTQRERDAFERIATNQQPDCTWREIDVLLRAGVIERGSVETRRDAMGVYQIPSFIVPIPVHAQWCAWCAEQNRRME